MSCCCYIFILLGFFFPMDPTVCMKRNLITCKNRQLWCLLPAFLVEHCQSQQNFKYTVLKLWALKYCSVVMPYSPMWNPLINLYLHSYGHMNKIMTFYDTFFNPFIPIGKKNARVLGFLVNSWKSKLVDLKASSKQWLNSQSAGLDFGMVATKVHAKKGLLWSH